MLAMKEAPTKPWRWVVGFKCILLKGSDETLGASKASSSTVLGADPGQGQITIFVITLVITVLEKPQITVGGQRKSCCFEEQEVQCGERACYREGIFFSKGKRKKLDNSIHELYNKFGF